MKKKEKLINDIKSIIFNYGGFSISDVEYENSPVISIDGKINKIAESFDISGAYVTTYINEIEISEDYYFYEDLSTNILVDILSICKSFCTDCEKTMKRCKS